MLQHGSTPESENDSRYKKSKRDQPQHGSDSENDSRHKRHRREYLQRGSESDNDSKHKRHRREHRNGSRKVGNHDLEDVEM